MKQTKVFFKVIMVFIAMIIIFSGCEKDDPIPNEGEPVDVTIPIDDNSAFNMKNFIASFDQMFVADSRWAWNFSHDYTEGKATTSYQNYKIYGEFGDKVQTTTHNYNDDGVIISSGRTSNLYSGDILTFEYEYDINGFITKLTKYNQGELQDIVTHEYNTNNQLIKKTHEAIDTDDEEWEETFTYNSDGLVSVYENKRWGEKNEYKYSNGYMVEDHEYEDGVLERISYYEYDTKGRVTKVDEDDNTWNTVIEYTSDMMTILDYNEDLLEYKMEYGVGYKKIRSYSYYYNDGVFEYCRAKEDDDDGNTLKKYYYEGSIDNLQLVGYSVIDSRDENKDDKKTKESVYNASGTKLYYAEFTLSGSDDDYWYISDTNWFSSDGTSIDESDISESWVFVLVR